MKKTILNTKVNYDSLSRADKQIADFLIENPGKILPLSITELAERCGVSEATIVRFSKKFGFGGYQQLKIAIAKEEHTRPVNENITKEMVTAINGNKPTITVVAAAVQKDNIPNVETAWDKLPDAFKN